MNQETVYAHVRRAGLSRRGFLKLCSAMAALVGSRTVPWLREAPDLAARAHAARTARIAEGLQTQPRVPIIWLQLQDCAGCTSALTRSRRPTMVDLIFDAISLEYHETLSAAAGEQVLAHRATAMREHAGSYVLVLEGSVPGFAAACTVGGRSVREEVVAAAESAAAVVATGNCACYGGIPAAAPNPTAATDVRDVLSPRDVVCVPGCPAIPEVTAGTLVSLITGEGDMELDDLGRPLRYYGATVHDACERKRFFREGRFAASFDDEGARNGWCLFELGCRGPQTANACAVMRWGDGLSFPVASGHPCLGCSEPGFWDDGSFYPWSPRARSLYAPWAATGAS